MTDETKDFTYLVQPGPPERTIAASFYERYRKEKGSVPIIQAEAILFGEYLAQHLEEFQTELKLYLHILAQNPNPPEASGS